MPRIPPTLLRLARRRNRLLPSLLPVCRDLPSSQNELRWLREHAAEVASKQGLKDENRLLQQYVSRRAKGEPLQYILGTEYFGELEIECRPGVLIPRQETAASVSYLAELLLQSWKRSGSVDPINVLDLCTGTGCIPLLFHHELFKLPSIAAEIGRVVGVDISPQALRLSEDNKAKQLHDQSVYGSSKSTKLGTLRKLQFVHADILADEDSSSSVMNKLRDIGPQKPNYEVLISNPPYISSAAFRITTAASVRRYEPKLALVPPHSPTQQIVEDGDAFYPKLYDIAKSVNSKVVLFEVADMEQACRVAAMADNHWATVEIWRDDPGATVVQTEYADVGHGERQRVRVRGQGNGRSVVAYTNEGSQWCITV